MKSSFIPNSTFRTFIALIAILVSVSACKSTEKTLHQGDYDAVILKTVKKLQGNTQKEKYVVLLEEAFNKANARDLNTIQNLKATGDPSKQMRIYDLFVQLDRRQNKIAPLLPLYAGGRTANIKLKDYHQDILAAKQAAADYLYAYGSRLLQNKNKADARQAYTQFTSLKGLYSSFRDVDSKIAAAKKAGTQHVLVKMKNSTRLIMPNGFEQALLELNVRNFNQNWVQYHTRSKALVNYDYDIFLNLQDIDVSPESIREKEYAQSREIKEGWTWAVDNNGKYVLDSLGNKIKVEQLVQVNCMVLETEQHKIARVIGSVDYFHRASRRQVASHPITTDAVFSNRFASIRGDERALNNAVKDLACNLPLPFPSDEALILQANENLKQNLGNIIRDNRSLIRI